MKLNEKQLQTKPSFTQLLLTYNQYYSPVDGLQVHVASGNKLFMFKPPLIRSRNPGLILLLASVLLLGACVPLSTQASPVNTLLSPTKIIEANPTGTNVYPTNPTATGKITCTERLVPAVISETQPQEVNPGMEITVSGSGGYLQDDCGFYNESARTFKLYLDHEPVADLTCYVNHCEAKIVLPPDTPAGSHCLSTDQNGCEYQLMVNS